MKHLFFIYDRSNLKEEESEIRLKGFIQNLITFSFAYIIAFYFFLNVFYKLLYRHNTTITVILHIKFESIGTGLYLCHSKLLFHSCFVRPLYLLYFMRILKSV